MNFSNYSRIGEFGLGVKNTPKNEPLTYCVTNGIQSGWSHTIGGGNSLVGPNSTQCQIFMAGHCSEKWDGACEVYSRDKSRAFPNSVTSCNNPNGSCDGPGIGNGLTQGEVLIYNTAAEKYLDSMSSNCSRKYEPFDPTNPDSPLISKWVPNGQSCGNGISGVSCNGNSNVCVGRYDIKDVKGLDSDIVMNKILQNPWKYIDLLVKIYNTRRMNRTLQLLQNTKLGRFYNSEDFQQFANQIWR